jgi:CSLREA domain-containing protein
MKVLTILAIASVQGLAAHAATIHVNSTADQIADNGLCSLREAVISANTNAPSGATPGECASGSSGSTDVIVIPAGTYLLTLAGPEEEYATEAAVGDLDATQSVTITGAGRDATILDGAALDARVLQIAATSGAVTVSKLTIRNGSELSFPDAGDGGGLVADGPSTLVVTDARFTGNSAISGGGIAVGSDVLSATFSRLFVDGNTAEREGGGIYIYSTAQIADSIIIGNSTTNDYSLYGGGGIMLYAASLVMSRSTITENSTAGVGGGLFAYWGAALTATDSTIDHNTAAYHGGGLELSNANPSSLTNCTISDNAAASDGGGIDSTNSDPFTLTHVTLAGNTAPNSSGMYVDDAATIRNSILSGTCDGTFVTSQGGNIESPGDNCGLNHATDQVAVSAVTLGLQELAFNGGPTRTRLLSTPSAAVDTARAIYCTPKDQRGKTRPQGVACDVGSLERVPGAIFYDGFESGTLGEWSSHVP